MTPSRPSAAGEEEHAVEEREAQPDGGLREVQRAAHRARVIGRGSRTGDRLDERAARRAWPQPADGHLDDLAEGVERTRPRPAREISSAETTAPSAASSSSSTANSLGLSSSRRPRSRRRCAARSRGAGRRGRGSAAEPARERRAEGADASHELGEVERLGQVVVGARGRGPRRGPRRRRRRSA